MNFKMRVFFYKSEGIAEELVEVLSREYRVKGDPIPLLSRLRARN